MAHCTALRWYVRRLRLPRRAGLNMQRFQAGASRSTAAALEQAAPTVDLQSGWDGGRRSTVYAAGAWSRTSVTGPGESPGETAAGQGPAKCARQMFSDHFRGPTSTTYSATPTMPDLRAGQHTHVLTMSDPWSCPFFCCRASTTA